MEDKSDTHTKSMEDEADNQMNSMEGEDINIPRYGR